MYTIWGDETRTGKYYGNHLRGISINSFWQSFTASYTPDSQPFLSSDNIACLLACQLSIHGLLSLILFLLKSQCVLVFTYFAIIKDDMAIHRANKRALFSPVAQSEWMIQRIYETELCSWVTGLHSLQLDSDPDWPSSHVCSTWKELADFVPFVLGYWDTKLKLN